MFIGTSYHEHKPVHLASKTADKIVEDLSSKSKKLALEVATYFSEMREVFEEMGRYLAPGARACIVIGNTKLRGVDILNAEVFLEQFVDLGFELDDVIKREIPSKNLPSTRDPRTGRFTGVTDSLKVLVYPTEYILVLKK